MSKRRTPPLVCLLGIDPEKSKKCHASECRTCGWEAAEAARRREYMKEHGLTLCADGLWRLIMKKEENEMATPYKECPYCGAHLDSGETCDCRETKQESKDRSCENCGNIACSSSVVAVFYDECIKTNYQKHWRAKA